MATESQNNGDILNQLAVAPHWERLCQMINEEYFTMPEEFRDLRTETRERLLTAVNSSRQAFAHLYPQSVRLMERVSAMFRKPEVKPAYETLTPEELNVALQALATQGKIAEVVLRESTVQQWMRERRGTTTPERPKVIVLLKQQSQ